MAKHKKQIEPAHPLKINGKEWDQIKVMDVVCERIATSTRSIVTILAEPHDGYDLPTYTTIKRWLVANEIICSQYTRAKEDQADFMAEEMIEIADDSRNDFMEKVNASGEAYIVGDQEMVSRARLRLDTRKWLASKLKPKKYGDKLAVGGADDLPPVRHDVTMTPEEAYRQLLNGK